MRIETLLRNWSRRTALAGVSVVALASPQSLLAQTTNQTTTPQAMGRDPTADLTELVVTARRREERLQDVPAAVTAFSAETLREQGIRDITEVALQTPGFSMQNASRQNEQPFIRGMSVNSVFRDAQNASFFIDGVYVAGVARTVGLRDVERIEVVLGPQAVYFGRATFAGAVNYVTRKPQTDRFGWEADTTIGEHGLFDVSAGINVPVVQDKLAVRGFFQQHRYGGEYRNSLTGDRLGTERTFGSSTSILWTPIESFDALYRIQYTRNDDGHSATTVYDPRVNNNCLPNAAGARQFFCGELRNPTEADIALNLDRLPERGYRRVRQTRQSLSLNYRFEGYALSSLTGFNYEAQDLSSDGDATRFSPQGGLLQSLFKSKFDDFTQEVRLTSPFENRFRWLVGGTYFTSSRMESSLVFPIVSISNRRETENRAIFGSLAFDVTEQLTLTGEGRYQVDEIAVQNTTLRAKFKKFLPRVVVDYKPSDDVLLYALYAKGNKPGSFNTAAGTPPDLIVVDEEELDNFEIGAKTTWLDDRLRLNATAYFIDWSNQAYQDTVFQRDAAGNPILAPNGQPRTVVVTVNVGKTEIKGLEADAVYRVIPGWSLRAAYAYTDAQYKDFLSRLPITYSGAAAKVDGNALQNTPKHKLTLSTTYERPLGGTGLDLFLSSDVTFRSKQYLDELNTAYVGNLTLLNARVGVQNDRYSIYVFGRNLTDSRVPDFATRSLDFNTNINSYLFTLRPSRSFGVSASVRY